MAGSSHIHQVIKSRWNFQDKQIPYFSRPSTVFPKQFKDFFSCLKFKAGLDLKAGAGILLPGKGILRGVFLANHFASTHNLSVTTYAKREDRHSLASSPFTTSGQARSESILSTPEPAQGYSTAIYSCKNRLSSVHRTDYNSIYTWKFPLSINNDLYSKTSGYTHTHQKENLDSTCIFNTSDIMLQLPFSPASELYIITLGHSRSGNTVTGTTSK